MCNQHNIIFPLLNMTRKKMWVPYFFYIKHQISKTDRLLLLVRNKNTMLQIRKIQRLILKAPKPKTKDLFQLQWTIMVTVLPKGENDPWQNKLWKDYQPTESVKYHVNDTNNVLKGIKECAWNMKNYVDAYCILHKKLCHIK